MLFSRSNLRIFRFQMIENLNVLELLGILLAILGILLGGASVGIYKYLSWKIQNDSVEKTEKVVKQRNAELFLAIGYNYWYQFSIQSKRNLSSYKEHEKKDYYAHLAELLAQAMTITRKGIQSCKGLDEKENEEIIGLLKNNYAYFVTELSDPIPDGQKKIANTYADFIESISANYAEHVEDWEDTVTTVRNRFKKKKEQ